MYYLVCVLVFIIAILVYLMIEQRRKYTLDLSKKDKRISEILEECSIYEQKCEKLKDIIKINDEVQKVEPSNIIEEPKYEPIYKGKKALVGDYLAISYTQTKKTLENLGFEVTIALSSDEVVERIKNGEKYDIIFSNNIYRGGTGPECLSKLKEIEGFNTPVIIHTITKNAEYHFVNEVGFDAYIEKPVTQEKVKPILKKLLH